MKSEMFRTERRSDAELAVVATGDPQAFGELYRRHERSVLSYFLHWCGSGDLSADLTAETFAAALGSLAGFDAERGDFGAWLFGIAHHVLARSLERGRVEDDARQRLGMPRLLIDDEALERIEALDSSVTALLDQLAEPLRLAVAGRVLEEREYRDLARSLACSPALVRQRVRRGLARLRELMEASE
jgi:RNA polymerase sigma factor (sigma-70 family)